MFTALYYDFEEVKFKYPECIPIFKQLLDNNMFKNK